MLVMGRKNSNCAITEEDSDRIQLNHFNENILKHHQMKMVVILGSCYGLRGSKESSSLTQDNVAAGKYPNSYQGFPGVEWYGLTGLSDKTLQLSFSNHHLRDTEDFMKRPILPDNLSCDVGEEETGEMPAAIPQNLCVWNILH